MRNSMLVILFCIPLLFMCSELHIGKIQDPGGYIKLYPSYFLSFDGQYYIGKNGEKFLYDPLKYSEDNPDLFDQIRDKYTGTRCLTNQNNPGTVRNESFFKYIYGKNKSEVEKNLVCVRWLPSTLNQGVLINKEAGCAKSLQEISDILDKRPDLKKYLKVRIEGYNWRNIAGSNLLSMHSYGIAVDVCLDYSDYWRDHIGERYRYRNRVPKEIRQIFEQHGFIWAGTWYYYDTMHFEYRPELFQ